MTLNKSAPDPPGEKCGNSASITAETRENKPYKDKNPYPNNEKCYITVSKTANSNKTSTHIILKKVIPTHAGAGVIADVGDHQGGVLWYGFKAHSCPEVKIFF